MTGQRDGARATRFSTFAPEPFAAHLDVVWLGMPDDAQCGGRRIVPVTALPEHRDAIVEAMVRHYGGDPARHTRALVSQWSKYYFGRAVPAGVVAALTLGRPLDMTPERTFVALDDGMPAALYFAADALGAPCDEPARRHAGLVAHLRATIALLAGIGGVTQRVLWSNAGNLLDFLFDRYRTLPCAVDRARDAEWLFGATCLDGEPNPLRLPVRDVVPRSPLLPTPFRARRVCCLRYEIPGETQLCGSCPLLLTMDDAALAEQDATR
ncbi:siderophore-iron reductase FhuF [Burkholderia multivorans]|uniref:Ferric iron reductase n=1 Tax=Burkholderia multivorans (strain ATCC 17616 / 249) TaxID=395019 RepID=A0A0H3KEN4_BURM1|nr:siderophore-iron reductase FhuF [Burkholderia multivorans]ABX15289.1 ferric iron reductase [Burkholderia multivorans ATCC 17616]PRF59860.1 siderophore-iron reductase FhuF [Burkholderia multivorans]BAG43563.1 ferric iron reductase [Burkholderia multivorans ATCC 17616]